MKAYEKPMVLQNSDVAEGVFMASGEECEIRIITQTLNKLSNGKWRAEIAWEHSLLNHFCDGLHIYLTFNQSVEFEQSFSWVKPNGSGTGTSITIDYDEKSYNNGSVQLNFKSGDGLQLVNVSATEY